MEGSGASGDVAGRLGAADLAEVVLCAGLVTPGTKLLGLARSACSCAKPSGWASSPKSSGAGTGSGTSGFCTGSGTLPAVGTGNGMLRLGFGMGMLPVLGLGCGIGMGMVPGSGLPVLALFGFGIGMPLRYFGSDNGETPSKLNFLLSSAMASHKS